MLNFGLNTSRHLLNLSTNELQNIVFDLIFQTLMNNLLTVKNYIQHYNIVLQRIL